jgi:hypothetical protein
VENSKIDSSTCKLCGKKFSSFAEMQQHMTINHMQQGNISNTMTYASGETNITTENVKNNSTEQYEDLPQIKEHELDYKRRRKRIEFTDGLSEEELIKRANSSPPSPSPSPQAVLSSSDKSKT